MADGTTFVSAKWFSTFFTRTWFLPFPSTYLPSFADTQDRPYMMTSISRYITYCSLPFLWWWGPFFSKTLTLWSKKVRNHCSWKHKECISKAILKLESSTLQNQPKSWNNNNFCQVIYKSTSSSTAFSPKYILSVSKMPSSTTQTISYGLYKAYLKRLWSFCSVFTRLTVESSTKKVTVQICGSLVSLHFQPLSLLWRSSYRLTPSSGPSSYSSPFPYYPYVFTLDGCGFLTTTSHNTLSEQLLLPGQLLSAIS